MAVFASDWHLSAACVNCQGLIGVRETKIIYLYLISEPWSLSSIQCVWGGGGIDLRVHFVIQGWMHPKTVTVFWLYWILISHALQIQRMKGLIHSIVHSLIFQFLSVASLLQRGFKLLQYNVNEERSSTEVSSVTEYEQHDWRNRPTAL